MTTETFQLQPLTPFAIEIAELNQLAADYKDLVVTETTMEHAKKARERLREKRYEIQNTEKENASKIAKFRKEMGAFADQLIAIVLPVEERIDSGIKAIENRKAEEKARQERELKEKVEARKKSLFDAGMSFNGSDFILGTIRIHPVEIEAFTDDQYTKFAARIAEEKAREEARLAEIAAEEKRKAEEQERIRKEQEAEAARLENIRRENEAAARKIKEEAEKLEKQKRDAAEAEERAKAEAEKQRFNSRASALMALGMSFHGLHYSFDKFLVGREEIEQFSDVEWIAFLDRITPEIKERKAEIEAETRRKQEAAARVAAEAKLKAEQEAAAAEAKRKEEEDRKRIAMLPDKEKLQRLHVRILNTEYEEVVSPESVKILAEVKKRVQALSDWLDNEIESL